MFFAVRIASDRRRTWAMAMQRELQDADDPLSWAAGCLLTLLIERLQPMQTLVTAARWFVAAVTAAYAAFHFKMAWNGAMVLMGGPDWYYDKLIAWGHPDQAEGYQQAQPFIFAYMLLIGITHLGAAIFLVRWRPKAFYAFLAVAAVMVLAFTGLRVIPFQAGPLALLAAAACVLALMNRKSPPLATA